MLSNPTGQLSPPSTLSIGPRTQSKGTGFLLRSGFIVTNHHVIAGCQASEVIAFSCTGAQIGFKSLDSDPRVDLALLGPNHALAGGLVLRSPYDVSIGSEVATFGDIRWATMARPPFLLSDISPVIKPTVLLPSSTS